MLAASVAAGIGSFALGETDLLRVAIIIVIVCLLTWLLCVLLPARLRTSFHTEPAEAPVDSVVRLSVDTRVRRPMLPATVVCHLIADPALSTMNHLAVPGRRVRAGIPLGFSTTVLRRGVHTAGPLEVTMRDPLGLVSARYVGTRTTTVLGLPRRYSVDPGWLDTIGVLYAGQSTTSENLEGEPDVGVREHRPEDGQRRIHWRTSARTGRLMTRLDHPESDRTAVVAYESRASLHRAETFEVTLEVVASLAAALLDQGWGVRLVDSVGERHAPGGGWSTGSLMRFLALAEPVDGGDAPALPADRTPVLMVTTQVPRRPELVAQTIVVALPGTPVSKAPAVHTLADGGSAADLLGNPPRIEARQ